MSLGEKLKYLDPYHYMDLFVDFLHTKGIDYKLVDIIIYIVFSLILAFIILKLLGLILGTSEAAMIVVSGSMDPTLHIGDIAILKAPTLLMPAEIKIDENLANKPINKFMKINYKYMNLVKDGKTYTLINTENVEINGKKYEPKPEGPIIVYYSSLQNKKIIHRAIFKLVANDGNYYITKGDNTLTNTLIDADCGIDALGQPTKPCITLLPIPEKEVLAKYWFKIPYVGLIKIWTFGLLGLNA